MSKVENKSSLKDQVVEKTIQAVSDSPHLNETVLAHLSELASSGGLTDFKKIVSALRADEEQ